MDEQQLQQINKYIDLFFRRKNIIACFLLLGIVAGLGFYIRTPKSYQATSLLIYQRQRINPSEMSPDVKTNTEEMVSNLSKQVTSRTNLEKLIKKFDLYPATSGKLAMEDIITVMRDNYIEIKQGKGDIFTVSYQGNTPDKAMLVTNALAEKFVEENLRSREERVTETSAYVKDELNMAKEALDKKEAAMRDYKLKYYNEMPEQLQNNIARLNTLETQHQGVQESIQDLERTKIMIQEQMTLQTTMLDQAVFREREHLEKLGDKSTGNIRLTGNESADIVRVRSELEALKVKYTEQHPEVKRARKLLVKLEENLAGKVSGQVSPANNIVADSQLQQLHRQLKDAEYNISRLKEDKTEVKKQIEQYKKWVENTYIREAEWSALTRDYNQLNDHYQGLVGRNLSAESVENLERRQKGSQFKIVDPARLPEKPFKPNFKKIMLLSIAFGLGVGIGIAFLVDSMNTSFRDAAELESYLDMNITCSIPMLCTAQEEKRNNTLNRLWASSFIGAIAVLIGFFVYLWEKGIIII